MSDSRSIAGQQTRYRDDERGAALRALLMTSLMTASHPEFGAVRRHADELRAWFARETGWPLRVERDCARLYKRPADLDDASRGLPGYDRRRYVLLCLACAVLERAGPQITLRSLGEDLLRLGSDPALMALGFRFELTAQHERRELVAVCRSLLEWGVLQRIVGDEEGFVRAGPGESGDALYDVQRQVLAGILAAVRGPSTWPAGQAPAALPDRLAALVREPVPDSEEGTRTALRHHLARRLLDDPVIYLDTLDAAQLAYFTNQRGTMANRLCEAAGLIAEQRAEGTALVDADGALTDVAMPAEGTEAHVTLLVAEFLTRQGGSPTLDAVAKFIAEGRARYGRYWRKSAREPGSEHELARIAAERLAKLQLVRIVDERIQPLPALARYALGAAEVRAPGADAPRELFDTP